MLLLMITLHFAVQSQSSDTICIPKTDAIKLLSKAEEGKLLSEKVSLLNEQIFLLSQRIAEKQAIISGLEQTEGYQDSLIGSYKKEIELIRDQKKILEEAVAATKKEVRRFKRKLFFRTAGGVMVTGALVYLYVTK